MAEEKTTVKKTVKKSTTPKIVTFEGTGRRKQSIARIRLIPGGKGLFIINDKNIEEYLPLGTLRLIANQPLELTKTVGKYDIYANVHGGGLTGQAGAIRHGISRALAKAEEMLKPELKTAGLLTRDARSKERKKYGLHKARKAPQFRKR